MIRNPYSLLFYLFIIAISAGCLNTISDNEKEYNIYRCETKTMGLKGVIDSIDSRANYMQAHLNNKKDYFSLTIAEIKLNQGFPESYSFNVGDSLIKQPGSKEFIVKRGKNLAIFILKCND